MHLSFVRTRSYTNLLKYLVYKKGMIHLNQNFGSLNTPPSNIEDMKIEDIKLTEDHKDPLFYAIELFFTPCIKAVDFVHNIYGHIISFFHHQE